jgi:3-keto-disaccharide hydrolase
MRRQAMLRCALVLLPAFLPTQEEWNSVEIAARDGQVKSSLNGTLISTISEHEFTEAGFIGFQSEGAEIHWRNIRIKAE